MASLPGRFFFVMASLLTRVLLVCVFNGLGSLTKVFQHGARALQYNVLCPIVVISLAKLACSLALYRLYDGPLVGFFGQLRHFWVLVLRYGVVAGLFCLYDVLSFVNLKTFDPQTYSVFLQLRTVLIGVVWEAAFGKRLGGMQRLGLVLIFSGCVAKQMGDGFNLEAAARVPPAQYFLLAVQIVSNVLAAVTNELLLKDKGGAPLNLQNAAQYTWTLFWCMLVGCLCPLEGVHINPLNFEMWAQMADPRMLPNIVAFSVLGLVTSVLLKLMDSIWKAIATSAELFLTAYASAYVFGYPVRHSDLAALCVAAGGVWLYARWPHDAFASAAAAAATKGTKAS